MFSKRVTLSERYRRTDSMLGTFHSPPPPTPDSLYMNICIHMCICIRTCIHICISV